jgi:hypothetical protein
MGRKRLHKKFLSFIPVPHARDNTPAGIQKEIKIGLPKLFDSDKIKNWIPAVYSGECRMRQRYDGKNYDKQTNQHSIHFGRRAGNEAPTSNRKIINNIYCKIIL